MKGDHDDGDNRDNYGDGKGEGDCVPVFLYLDLHPLQLQDSW